MKFDFNTVEDFEKHIKDSIPSYSELIPQIRGYIECFAESGTDVVDLGCSTGSMLAGLKHQNDIRYIGVDNSDLLDECIHDSVIKVKEDVFESSKWKTYGKASVITSVFFMQFVPRSKRQILLNLIKESLNENGVFIVCEKVHFDDPLLENITFNLHQFNKCKEFSSNDIMLKSQKLIRSMWPKSESEIEKELEIIGKPTLFWKSYGFNGYIVQKGK